jgi:acetyl-CoA C-acetyltransferase
MKCLISSLIGKMGGSLASLSAPRLGAHAIKSAVEKSNIIDTSIIEECFMGNVVSAGIGQAPTRQAVIYAGLPLDVPSTTVNKVCASGMKAVMLAALSIGAGYRKVCIAGGMESMSNIPYYLPGARSGYRLGNQTVVDGLINDGLWDVYNNQHMGICGELCASKYGISRADQDEFAAMSYQRAASAWSTGVMDWEVAPVTLDGKKGAPTIVTTDEEFGGFNSAKMSALRQ